MAVLPALGLNRVPIFGSGGAVRPQAQSAEIDRDSYKESAMRSATAGA